MRVLVLGSKHKSYITNMLAKHVKQLNPDYEFYSENIPAPKRILGKVIPLQTDTVIKKLVAKYNPDLVLSRSVHIMHYLGKPAIYWMGGEPIQEAIINFKTLPKFVQLCRSLHQHLRQKQVSKNLETYPILCVSDYLAGNLRSGRSFRDYHYKGDSDNILQKNRNAATLYIAPGNNFMTIPDTKMELKHPCVGLLQNVNVAEKVKGMLKLESTIKEMPDVMFYWVGDGPYKYMTKPLEKYPNFVSLGHLESDEVKKFLYSIDVYVLASDMDTLGVSTLEAQLMERPVVVSHVGGAPETIQYGITGYSYTTSKSLTKYLKELLADPEFSRQMGKAGREFVMSKFSWPVIAQQFIEYSQRVMEGKTLNLEPNPFYTAHT